MASQLVDRPGHHQIPATTVVDDCHVPRDIDVSLNDGGLLDISPWRPHGHVVSPQNIFLTNLRDPARILPDIDRGIESEQRVVIDWSGTGSISEGEPGEDSNAEKRAVVIVPEHIMIVTWLNKETGREARAGDRD
jgi:hypothetical protein